MSTVDRIRADSASCAVKLVVGTMAEEQGVCVLELALFFFWNILRLALRTADCFALNGSEGELFKSTSELTR